MLRLEKRRLNRDITVFQSLTCKWLRVGHVMLCRKNVPGALKLACLLVRALD